MGKIEQAFNLLGFAQRAGKLTLGMTPTLNAIRKEETRTVVLATDISENSKSKIEETAKAHDIPVFMCGTKDEFGQIFGRNEIGIIGISDASFAIAIREFFD
ncbi:MAG: L7Ae/L30e/S12e/Gadd45 family ribosomal protein [bacterium]